MNSALRTPHSALQTFVRISLSRLRATAASRPPGYLEAVLAAGVVDGDYLRLPAAAYTQLRATYSPHAPSPEPRPSITGLGDLIHTVAHPAARALDATLGTHFQTCQKCGERRDTLNRHFPLP